MNWKIKNMTITNVITHELEKKKLTSCNFSLNELEIQHMHN
jgi:hypothetical protein